MPCFPTHKAKVVEPERGAVQYKNVHRYGETNIKHVGRPLRLDEWKKSARAQNAGRPLPSTPRQIAPEEQRMAAIRRQKLQRQPQVQSEGEESYAASEYQSLPSTRKPIPVKADFVISVPIFNETLNHSYRKKNEYVYVDGGNEDTMSLLHQSLSRSSSTKDLRSDRPPSARSSERAHRRVKSGHHSKRTRSYDENVYENSERVYANERSLRKERGSDRYHENSERVYVNERSSRKERGSDKYHDTDRERRVSDREHRADRRHRKHHSSGRKHYSSERQEDSPHGSRVLSDNQDYRSHRQDRQHSAHRGNYMFDERPPRQQVVPRPVSEKKRRPLSGSEASYNTMTSAGQSYIYEQMPPAYKMRRAASSGGLTIDSDDDDRR